MCWSRYKNWNKKNVKRKQNEKRKGGENITQNRNRRGKGRQLRAHNCGCKHHQKWSTRNKRKVKKTNTKEGKRERWQNKSKCNKEIGLKRRGCDGRKAGCMRKAKSNCQCEKGWRKFWVQKKQQKKQNSIDPASYLEK